MEFMMVGRAQPRSLHLPQDEIARAWSVDVWHRARATSLPHHPPTTRSAGLAAVRSRHASGKRRSNQSAQAEAF